MICNCTAGAAGRRGSSRTGGRRCAAGGGSRTGGSGNDGSRSGGRGVGSRGSLGRACGCPRKHCKSKCLQQLPDQHGYGIGAGDRSGKIYQRLHLLPRGRTVIQVYPDSKQNLPSVPPGRWTPLAICIAAANVWSHSTMILLAKSTSASCSTSLPARPIISGSGLMGMGPAFYPVCLF